MKPKHNVIVRKPAYAMLDKHVAFLARVSEKAANRLRADIIGAIRGLDSNPQRHPLWQPYYELPKEFRRIYVNKRYIILFTIKDNNVIVSYVLDTRMNNKEIFK